MAKILVKETEVTILQIKNEDYISLTDMLKAKQGEFLVSSWLRNRNTLEFIRIWESVHNPNFNYIEFDIIKSQAGLNRFIISVKELNEKANVICLQANMPILEAVYSILYQRKSPANMMKSLTLKLA
ncbi:MAG: KilA-N domain-containing protein [Prevotellaceae bacterium]|jgi:hypothetical protein|nr:KilA-N domain-containing protein [Prevotellaceae bacterium]